jgi:hypothetical protein
MKTLLQTLALLVCVSVNAQVTTPVIKANFGVDADLRANYYNGALVNGNDDWFNDLTGTGQGIIDTTGATAMVARYLIDPNYRKLPFYRTMSYPQYSVVNNRLLIDAVYIRDYNGQAGGDSTAFVTANKNGDSPQNWGGGVTSVLDKNDIAEAMLHVRRDGPNKTDSLWLFAGLSLQGTTGSRYSDFELYQTDIFYNRSTGKFTNYGPDAGHTSWKFDASGNIISPGDVIFTAEYSSSSLTLIEARIWVDKASLSLTPANFIWGGAFDGASTGSQFGYANIQPKTGGTYYTGLQSGNNTWAGPFGFIDGSNTYNTTYSNRQFMEFSVNLSKLGLDPITLIGGDACTMPFRRVLVKTRSSTSFSSQLKDFIGPFDFFLSAPVQAQADVPLFCGAISVSHLTVTNPISTSVYTWSTPNGHIFGSSSGTSVTVDSPGTYIVSQQLLSGCTTYASDTLTVAFDAGCWPLSRSVTELKGSLDKQKAHLSWNALNQGNSLTFTLERSSNGSDFTPVYTISGANPGSYAYPDDLSDFRGRYVYYRLQVKNTEGGVQYTKTVRLELEQKSGFGIAPNPVQNYLQLSVFSSKNQEMTYSIVGTAGQVLRSQRIAVKTGNNSIILDDIYTLAPGTYILALTSDRGTEWKKFVVAAASKF